MVAVVWSEDCPPRVDDLIAWCRERLAGFAVPRYFRTVGALPKTPSQRVQKFKLREAGVTADTVDRGDRAGGRRDT
jgi:crotonobetaine/carnitine-CoA ligase